MKAGMQWAVGMELPALEIEPITRTTLALFAGASGDHQPTHLDIDAHGMLMMAYLGRLLTDLVPQQRIRAFKSRFVAMTPVHAKPTCTGRVTALNEGLATLELEVRLGDGTTVVRGEAVVELP
jgi:acyl dehydratase